MFLKRLLDNVNRNRKRWEACVRGTVSVEGEVGDRVDYGVDKHDEKSCDSVH